MTKPRTHSHAFRRPTKTTDCTGEWRRTCRTRCVCGKIILGKTDARKLSRRMASWEAGTPGYSYECPKAPGAYHVTKSPPRTP
jgi:hypothetical protein